MKKGVRPERRYHFANGTADMAKAKKAIKKRVTKKVSEPVVYELSFRDKLEIKWVVLKAQLNSLWYLLRAKIRGY